MNTDIRHSGIYGMKWYVRRWQNPDGTYTPEGRIHYADQIQKYHDYLARRNGFAAVEDGLDEYGDTPFASIKNLFKVNWDRILGRL